MIATEMVNVLEILCAEGTTVEDIFQQGQIVAKKRVLLTYFFLYFSHFDNIIGT